MATRPDDLIYAVDDLPPWPRLLFLGAQNAVLASVYLVLVVIVFRHAGAGHAATVSAVSLGMVALAVTTALQALRRGPVGSGYLAPPVFSAIYLGPSLLAADAGGLPAVFGMTLLAALVEVGLAPLLTRLRGLFPPAVSGLIVLIVGVELGVIGLRDLLAVDQRGTPQFAAHLVVGWLTLAVMVGLSVWGRGLARLLCSTLGLAAGLAAGAAAGLVPDQAWRTFAAAPAFALPRPDYLAYAFAPELVPAFLIAGCAAMLRTVGVITTCQKINDADWKRPDLRSIRGGVVADGLGCALGGLVGTIGMSTAPSLVGVAHGSGATSRYIAFACAMVLLVFALVPKYAALFLILPQPVVGAAVTFTGSFMIAGGIQVIMSRNLDLRATFVVGIATLVALARGLYPAYFTTAPALVRSAAGSMLSLGVLAAVLLNAAFRIGATRRVTVTLEGAEGSLDQLERTLRGRATAWKLGAATLDRAVSTTRQLIGHLESAGLVRGPAQVSLACDEAELTVTVSYTGAPLVLPHTAVHRRPLLEEQAFSYGLADALTGVHADRMTGRVRRDQVAITLSFDR
jgi:xanthine permease XanP